MHSEVAPEVVRLMTQQDNLPTRRDRNDLLP